MGFGLRGFSLGLRISGLELWGFEGIGLGIALGSIFCRGWVYDCLALLKALTTPNIPSALMYGL